MLALTKGHKRALRLVLLAALLGALLLAGKLSGIGARLSAAELRALTLRAGAWGWALFTAVFALGELIHVPGLVFVAGGVLAYGRLWGGLLSWAAALVSISVTFFVVRAIGGRPLAEAESAWLRRVLSRLEARPVRTVALLRVVFILSPTLN